LPWFTIDGVKDYFRFSGIGAESGPGRMVQRDPVRDRRRERRTDQGNIHVTDDRLLNSSNNEGARYLYTSRSSSPSYSITKDKGTIRDEHEQSPDWFLFCLAVIQHVTTLHH
jgi:hypothetical protein